jgi:hypothetical protein
LAPLVQLLPLPPLALPAEPRTLATTAALVDLDNENTALDRVDEDVSTGEQEMTPSPHERHSALARIILGIDIKERFRSHALTRGILLNRSNIVHPDAIPVIRLVRKAVYDVQVVVDALLIRGPEVARVLGVLQVREVGDVGDGAPRGSGAGFVLLVQLVVEQDVLVPVALGPPALVHVRGAGVGQLGEDLGRGLAVLGGGVVDGDGVLVVADADVAAAVTAVRPVVGHALGVVHVAVLAGTAGGAGVCRVLEVDVLQAGAAGLVAGLGADGNGVLVVPVDDDVVGAADGEGVAEQTCEVLLGVENLGALGVERQELVEVEDLDVVANGLGADDNVVVQDTDLAPAGADGVLGREAAEVLDLALLRDLDEGGSAELANDTELTSVLGSPTPGRGSTTLGTTDISVVREIVEVHVVASEGLVGITRLDNGQTLLALNLLLLAKLDSCVVLPRRPEGGVVGTNSQLLVMSPLVLCRVSQQ